MQQISTAWQALDTRRRMIAGAAAVAMFAAILALSGLAAKPRMALLYAGLEAAQAGQVVSALDQRGVSYEVKGDSIWVDAAQRDALRMSLASDGLPESGGNGYELLDTLSGFGTTSQMFDAAYWRAKEGELARTILSNHEIRAARVHIANPVGQGFRNTVRPTASVTVTTVNGGLSPPQAKALKYMVSSAVSGMRPEDVSIIDSASGLVSVGDDTPQRSNDMRAAELRRNAERVLEARVGYGNAVVEVAVDTVTEREAVTERRIDPQTRVAISTDSEERKRQDSNNRSGATTVASNLPEGNGANDSRSQSQDNETRERTNYEVSETTREVVRDPGDIKRLTVAVLVDGVEGKDDKGQPTTAPRSDEEIAALHDLVASAVGFDEARGDVITIRSMPFRPLEATGTEATGGFLASQSFDLMRMAEIGVVALVVLILGLFVVRPMLLQRREPALPAPSGGAGLPVPVADSLPAMAAPAMAMPAMAPMAEPELVMPSFGMADISLPGETVGAMEGDPVARLRTLIQQRRAESAEILRGWMETPDREV
ncbi:flagellar basal-body MS-ring/collar protein FliF [Paenirhodobacter enshiensis]|uniref:Flagellar M-ring protein n=1 Tax=Paenirhodobacter enshiensis TaxID=1105367 RepID=A0A086Y3Q4_9RHOB|nr:flagellar basal-body MS-ring/collar protein FliF [Paenirhodobacter enshiensis]KFI28904.1 flagellar M-ring protein FliF [Paenirhodobacter enshiensis]